MHVLLVTLYGHYKPTTLTTGNRISLPVIFNAKWETLMFDVFMSEKYIVLEEREIPKYVPVLIFF